MCLDKNRTFFLLYDISTVQIQFLFQHHCKTSSFKFVVSTFLVQSVFTIRVSPMNTPLESKVTLNSKLDNDNIGKRFIEIIK